MKRFKFRPVVQSQFATLFVSAKPKIDEQGYADAYPTVERAIQALPKKHGGVLIVRGKLKIDKPIKLPTRIPVTLVGGEYKLGRKVPCFLSISEGPKSHVFTDMTVNGNGKNAVVSFKNRK